MIWYFTRGHAHICVEIRRAPETGGYSLVLIDPQGVERTRSYGSARRLIARALREQRKLIRGGWVPTSPTGERIDVRDAGSRIHRVADRLRRAATRVAATFGF
jgi:hypothetical protein